MRKKIAICTVMTMNPEHPRIMSEMKVLTEAGHDVKIIHSTYPKSGMSLFINYFFSLLYHFSGGILSLNTENLYL